MTLTSYLIFVFGPFTMQKNVIVEWCNTIGLLKALTFVPENEMFVGDLPILLDNAANVHTDNKCLRS